MYMETFIDAANEVRANMEDLDRAYVDVSERHPKSFALTCISVQRGEVLERAKRLRALRVVPEAVVKPLQDKLGDAVRLSGSCDVAAWSDTLVREVALEAYRMRVRLAQAESRGVAALLEEEVEP